MQSDCHVFIYPSTNRPLINMKLQGDPKKQATTKLWKNRIKPY